MNKKRRIRSVFFHRAYLAPVPQSRLQKIAAAIYFGEKIPARKNVHVIFCSDYFIKKLNGKFRDNPFPTDVLSFNYNEDDLLGEVYISIERAKIQARRYNVSYIDEIVRLFVHGMLHLSGYDHERTKDRKRMEAREKRYFH